MVIAAVMRANASLNQLPRAESKTKPKGVSIRETVLGIPDPGYHKLSLPFGQYCQVYEGPDTPNTTAPRTLGAIALHPTGNAQGSHYFMLLRTGQRISRQQWDVLPITPAVVARVEAIAESEREPLIPNDGMTFLRVNGTTIGENDKVPQTPQEHEYSNPVENEERTETVKTKERASIDTIEMRSALRMTTSKTRTRTWKARTPTRKTTLPPRMTMHQHPRLPRQQQM